MKAWKCGVVLAMALAACGKSERAKDGGSDTGAVTLSVGLAAGGAGAASGRAAATTPPDAYGRVASLVVTYIGPTTGTRTITAIANPIHVTFDALPVGLYVFSATAYDASAVALFSGQVQVTVRKNQLAAANLILQQLLPPGTVDDGSPVIRSIVMSDAAPASGETITLVADVKDSTDQLTYLWTSHCSGALGDAGETFSDPTKTATSFTSYCVGNETITFHVTQSAAAGGRTAATSLTLKYAAQGAGLALVFNSFPDILEITTAAPADNTQPAYGGHINLVATVRDLDGDSVTPAWTDDCGGSFDDPASLTPVWTAPRAPHGTKPPTWPQACKLALGVTDTHGGRNVGWLTVHVGGAVALTPVKQLPLPQVAYVANGNATISAYGVSPATGALTPIATAATTGRTPNAIAVHPSNRFVFTADRTTNGLSAFPVNADGSLGTPSSVTQPTAPTCLAVHPGGKLVFVGDDDSTVWVYSVDASTGALQPAGTADLGAAVSALAVDPTGKLLFVSAYSSTFTYSISAAGALTQVGSQVSLEARSIAIDPTGRFLVAVDGSWGAFKTFAIDAATGLTEVDFRAGGDDEPSGVAIDPTGRYVYVTTVGGDVSTLAIDPASGTLTSVGTAVAAGGHPSSIGVDPSGRFVYVTTDAGRVSVFTIAADGTLNASGTAATGSSPHGMAVTGAYPPPFLYVAHYVANDDGTAGGQIDRFAIDPASGTLTTLDPAGVGYPYSDMAADPLGRFVYTTDSASSRVTAFAVNPLTGALTTVATVPVPVAYGIAVDPTGRFAFVASFQNKVDGVVVGFVAAYGINQVTGELTYVNQVTAQSAYELATDPSGRFLYAMTNGGGSLTTYSIDRTSGAITFVDSKRIDTSATRAALALDPFGRFLYANNHVMTLDPRTGIPTPGATSPGGSLVVDPSGRFAYGATGGSAYFGSVDPGSGAITVLGTVPGLRNAISVAMDPSGSFLHAVFVIPGHGSAPRSGGFATYAVDPFTGALTPVGALTTGSYASARPRIVTVPGRARWAYVEVPSTPQHLLGGSVSGLTGTVVLANAATGETLSLAANASFVFGTPVAEGAAYDVQVRTQPAGQTCTVTNGAGVMGETDVGNVSVSCNWTTTYTIGGTVTGLSGTVALQNNGGDDLSLTSDGNFTFATPVIPNGSYDVTVRTQPATQVCVVGNGSGTGVNANVTTVAVTCAARSSAKDITQFAILGVNGTISGTNIAFTLPTGVAVSSLTPTIAMTGASVTPPSGTAQDFTNPVTYTVTAADGTTQQYTITVTVTPLAITSFVFRSADNSSVLTTDAAGFIGASHVAVPVPNGTVAASLTPTVAVTIPGATVTPASGAAQSFASAVNYTVSYAGINKTYSVTVSGTNKNVILFTIDGVDGTLTTGGGSGSGTITLALPCGTSLTSLAPFIAFTGKSVSPASGVAMDFSNSATTPVVYTVTANDNTTKPWYATVTAPCP